MELTHIIWLHFGIAGFCLWLCQAMRPNGILEDYGNWLRSLYANPETRFYSYPLGRCEVCFSSWFALVSGVWIAAQTHNWLQPFESIGWFYLIVRYWTGYFPLEPWGIGIKASDSEAPIIRRDEEPDVSYPGAPEQITIVGTTIFGIVAAYAVGDKVYCVSINSAGAIKEIMSVGETDTLYNVELYTGETGLFYQSALQPYVSKLRGALIN
jgi:hypothetical protein